MKFNLNALKGLFGKLAKSGMADDVAKFATNYGDDVARGVSSNLDDVGRLYGESMLTPKSEAFIDALDDSPLFKSSGKQSPQLGFDGTPLTDPLPNDIPPVRYRSPYKDLDLADDPLSDTTTRLGQYYATPVFGSSSFHEIEPDPNFTVQVPEIPLDSLVFAQHITDPSVISVRPHKNTALGRWFQNQTQNLDTPNSFDFWGDSLNSDKFVEMFNKKRLAEIEMHNRLDSLPQFNDGDLPF